MTTEAGVLQPRLAPRGFFEAVRESSWHTRGLWAFTLLVVAHWVEHILQAVQLWALGWSLPEARGAVGIAFPALIREEWLHYGYNAAMLIGLLALVRGFSGQARTWWIATIWIQVWHHFEHLILLIQAQTGNAWFGAAVPTSVIQLLVPRVELHLFYNSLATAPMLVALWYHRRQSSDGDGSGRAVRQPSQPAPSTP